jgi:hypothetical protein
MNRPLALALLLTIATPTRGQDEKSPQLNSGTLAALKFRSIGPALMSGRIADLAIDPRRPHVWYVAAGSGNLWKTDNAGTTWQPIFDNYPSYSIGCVTLDPSQTSTLWVGTGEAVGGRHVGFGDGVYVSRDGGQSFTHKGLKESQHIGKIVVDPQDSKVVYVCSQGPLWSAGGERGLYKSTDGGESWQLILSRGPYTGVTDLVLDPRNPDILFAATHQRQRTVAALLNAGPESGIHKSIDGGATWRELRSGLPGADKGKIALALSPQNPEVLYATIELAGRKGGFWSSADGGESWTKESDYLSGGTGPHYYQEIWADPHREGVIYQANVVLGRSEDGGKTWKAMRNPWKHVDNHALAFHPSDPDFLLVGCDGGLYRSYDRGKTYDFTENLPLTQFYKVDVDYDWPVYHVVGGTQDNNTQYGPSRTLTRNGILNSDWQITIGGDGHDCAIDPEDPHIVYCESQGGYLRRWDRRNGESVDIRPQPGQGEDNLRFNWDSPIHISPHANTRLYFGSKKLHRSDDRGDSWTAISDDLSRGLDRLHLKIMDRVWSVDAAWDLRAMSMFGNITSISESPVVEGLIYVGTDDGLIQITEDGGKTWRRVERIFGIPEYFFVNDIKADRHDADTVYVAMDNHKEGDFKPYLLKSIDRGHSWTSIATDLPYRHLVWRLIQDHENPDLLFVGTEFGVFTSLDAGAHWHQLKGGMPTIPVRDLEIQRRENDLVAATFGRSFYILDDYSPLREISEELLKEKALHLFPVKKALLYIERDRLGGRKGSQGDRFFVAENPPYGATFTYYLRDSVKTQEAERREQETKAKKAGGDNPAPAWEELKEEEREVGPQLLFEIRDQEGQVVDRVQASTSAGLHRFSWGLRYAPYTPQSWRGPLVVPGTYTIAALLRSGDETEELGTPRSFEVEALNQSTLEPQDRTATLAFQNELGTLQRAVTAAQEVLKQSLEELDEIENLVEGGRALPLGILDDARALEKDLLGLQDAISGDDERSRRGDPGKPSIARRIQTTLFGTLRQSYGPTGTQRQQYDIALADYREIEEALHKAVEGDLLALRKKIDAANAPWTRGRKIPRIGAAD